VHDAIDIANKAINVIKVNIGRPLKLTDSNQIVYSTASIITSKQIKYLRKQMKLKQRENLPGKKKWSKKILKKGSDLPALMEIQKGSHEREKREKQLEKLYNVKNATDIPVARELLKQQIQAEVQRICQFEKINYFFSQNRIFEIDAKKFYRELGGKTITVNDPPLVQEAEAFCSNI